MAQVLLTVKGLFPRNEEDEEKSALSESNRSAEGDGDSSVDSDFDDIYDMFHVDMGGVEGDPPDSPRQNSLGRSFTNSSEGSGATRLSLSFARQNSGRRKRPSVILKERRLSQARRFSSQKQSAKKWRLSQGRLSSPHKQSA